MQKSTRFTLADDSLFSHDPCVWLNSITVRRTRMLVTLHESCKLVLTFESVDEILKYDNSQESYWAVLSCGTVYYLVQGGSNFWVCGWNPKVLTIQMKATEPYFPIVYYAIQGGSNFWVCGWNPKVWPFKWKLLSSTFLWYLCFIMLYKVVRTFRQGMESLSVIIQTKPFLKYFHTVPFAFQHFTK